MRQGEPRLPLTGGKSWPEDLTFQLTALLRDYNRQLDGITEGSIVAFHNATTSAPTTGTYQQGDFILNSAPTEQGSVGSKYVVTKFLCVAAGTPGTWVSCRELTGN